MGDARYLFGESAFDDIYKGSFFDEDLPKYQQDAYKTKKSAEVAQIIGATSQVRMPTSADTSQEVDRAIQAHYGLNGNLGGGVSMPNFSGKIFGGI